MSTRIYSNDMRDRYAPNRLVRGETLDIPAVEREDLRSAGLLDYWKIIIRHKYTVLGLTLFGSLLGFLWTIPSPYLFDASTIIEIQAFNQNFMGISQVDPEAANYSMTDVNLATQLHILESGPLKARVLQRLNRELPPSTPPELPGLVAEFRRRVQTLMGRHRRDPLAAMQEAFMTASKTLDLQIVKNTRLIGISCQSTIPEVAAAFANAVANEYIDANMEQRVKSLQRTTQWFTAQLQEAKEKLERAETRLHSLNPTSGGSHDGPQDTLSTLKLSSLQQQLASIQAERITKEAQYHMASTSPEAVLDQTTLAPYKARVDDLRRTLASLTVTLTPAHYKVKRAQMDVAEAEAALNRERENLVERLAAEITTIKSREKMLQSAYAGQSRSVLAQSGRAMEYSLMQREVETSRQLYQMMLQQVNQANVASAVQASYLRVIEPAVPPSKPSKSIQTLTTLLGTVTGLILSLTLVIVLHHVDKSVRGPGHATTLLNVPELGVIPSGHSTAIKPFGSDKSFLGITRLEATPAVELVTWQQRPSLVADSFRSILASILIPNRVGLPQIIVTTSPNLKEGKSTITSNLGIAITELSRRVLLIDADLRRPRLHEIFDVVNDWGLSSLIQSTTTVDAYTASQLAVPTKIAGLSLLPSGPAVESVNALLYSPRLHALMTRLRREFDTVIIDTPPMVPFSDARVLAKIADGVILVLRSGITDQGSAMLARERLAEDGTWLIGTVLNDWTPTANESKVYRQYESYYGRSAG